MALSKVLQKMAKNNNNNPEGTDDPVEEDGGSAGILLSLLTEPPHQKVPARNSPPANLARKVPPSTQPSPSRAADTSTSSTAERKESSPPKTTSYDTQPSRSVLLQLLQERKMMMSSDMKKPRPDDKTKTTEEEDLVVVNSDPEPIVITPSANRNGHDRQADADRDVEEGDKILSIKESYSTQCKVCQKGFWDSAKYEEHMRMVHPLTKEETPDPENTANPAIDSSTIPSETLSKTPSPSITAEIDEAGPRRSKRKRTPARKRYIEEELLDVEDLEDLQPKIMCIEGSINVPETDAKPVRESDSLSRMSEGDIISDAELRPIIKVSASDTSEVSRHSEEESMDTLANRSVERVIEDIVNYKCSQCNLNFTSREETRNHLRKEHKVLSFSNPLQPMTPRSNSSASPVPSFSSHGPCNSCGCKSEEQKKAVSDRRCVICGKSETPNIKGFVNIFKARTWSSRYHQLARRLSNAFGCKFAIATCKSRIICVLCVQKLENVEKANMQLRQMVKSMKRTNLVTSADKLKMKSSNKKIAKATTSSVASSSEVEDTARSAHSKQSTNMPSAPLVRELLAAPEVLLPQSQFSELIDALGSGKSAVSSPLNVTQMVRGSFHDTDTVGASRRKSGDRRQQRQSRNLPTVQNNEAAFDEFVKELRAQQPPSDAALPKGQQYADELGRVLAEVRVKQEPGDSSEEVLAPNLQASPLNLVTSQDNISEYEVVANAINNVLEDLSSLYTRMQIDSSSGQTEYTCSLCTTSFYSEAAIQLHVKCHMPGSKDLQCFLCGYHNNLLPSQWRIMKRHLESEHKFPETYFHRYPCPVRGCAELFKRQQDMLVHVSKVHRTPASLPKEHALSDAGLFNFPCPLCGTLLQSEAALQVHVLCHNNSPKHYRCCYCGYMHTSQPGSWRIMRGHLAKEHIDKELPADIFSYHECPYYACRLKFCSKRAKIVHRACHDETKDGEFFCFQCRFSVPSTPYLWEKVRDHIIAKHPEAVGESFRCTCKARFDSFRDFMRHYNQVSTATARH